MSNIGLNSNIYHSTKVHLDLLNNFLIEVNYAKETGKSYSTEDVLNFFKVFLDESLIDPEKQLLRSFFKRFYKEKSKNIDKELLNIVKSLENGDLDEKILKDIEDLADVLKFQCVQSYARIKGTR